MEENKAESLHAVTAAVKPDNCTRIPLPFLPRLSFLVLQGPLGLPPFSQHRWDFFWSKIPIDHVTVNWMLVILLTYFTKSLYCIVL